MKRNKEMRNNIKRVPSALKMLWTYCIANIIILFHYDKQLFVKGKWFTGGHYGRFTALGWSWVVNDFFACRKLRIHNNVSWPVSPRIGVIYPENIEFHPDDLNNFQGFGNYYQGIGKITIGHGTYIAPNVGIITSNHSISNLNNHDIAKPVTIGARCWIGMNSVILPGITLGEKTIVGAGSIVTKSFPDGHCVIAGNPAKVIKIIPKDNKEETQ